MKSAPPPFYSSILTLSLSNWWFIVPAAEPLAPLGDYRIARFFDIPADVTVPSRGDPEFPDQ